MNVLDSPAAERESLICTPRRVGMRVPRIVDWPAPERPRERLLESGPEGLSDAELVALVLRSGRIRGETAVDLGRRLLGALGGTEGMARVTIAELACQGGVGVAS